MAVTLEERNRQLLKDLGLSEWPRLLEDLEALWEQAVQCLKKGSGYTLVSPPKGGGEQNSRSRSLVESRWHCSSKSSSS